MCRVQSGSFTAVQCHLQFSVCVCHRRWEKKREERMSVGHCCCCCCSIAAAATGHDQDLHRAQNIFTSSPGGSGGAGRKKIEASAASIVFTFSLIFFLLQQHSFSQLTATHTYINIHYEASRQAHRQAFSLWGWPSCRRNIQIRANFLSAIMAIMILIVSLPLSHSFVAFFFFFWVFLFSFSSFALSLNCFCPC